MGLKQALVLRLAQVIPFPNPLRPPCHQHYNIAMAYRSLADFLEELGCAGELARVEAEVNPALEIAHVARRLAGRDAPTLLFSRVTGRGFPVLTNLLATVERVCRALGVGSLADAEQRIANLLEPTQASGWLASLGAGSDASGPFAAFSPRRVKSAACQQSVRLGSDVDLNELPLLRCAQQETGPSITAAALVTAEPDSHRLVAGRYHLPLLSRDRLGIAWTGPDGPARLLDEFRRRAGRMPVAAVLGGDPACLLAASAVLPAAADPWVLAGVLRDKPLDVVACRTVDLHVPADADFVLEGYIDPSEPFVEAGPIHTSLGHCTLPRPVPVMHVTAITHRANPVFPALVPGSTPDESCVIDHALVRIFQPLVRHAVPELVDYDLPLFGAVRQWAVLSIRKTYPGQARRVASLAWGLRPFLFAKVLVLVGEEVDVRDANRVLSEIVAHVDPSRDIFFHQGPPDPLDPSQTPGTMGHRMALDATAKLAEERSGPRAQRAAIGEEVCRLVAERWNEYGLGPAPGVP